MNDSQFRRLAGICALIAGPTALVSFFILPFAFGGDFDAVFDPVRAIAHPSVRPDLVRLAWALDIAGYYFLLLPAVLVMGQWSREHSPLGSALSGRAALGYMISGSAGAAILAGTTGLFTRWQQADSAGRAVVSEIYITVFHMVDKGLWNTLCMSLLAVWLLLGGALLTRRHRKLGFAMAALGVCSALDVVGVLVQVEAVAMAGLFGYLMGFPVWSMALGLVILGGAKRG